MAQRGRTRDIQLSVNYFQITLGEVPVYQYRVDFEPYVTSKKIRHQLITNLRENFGQAFIFDGTHDLKTLQELADPLNLTTTRPYTNEEIAIKVTRVGNVAHESTEMERLLNTLFKNLHRVMEMVQIGRDYYFANRTRNMGDGIELMQGILTSVSYLSGGLMIQMDTIFKYSRSGTVYNFIRYFIETNPRNWLHEVSTQLADEIVWTTYNNKTYKVVSIDKNITPLSKFQSGGRDITYAEYYRQNYWDDRGRPLVIKDQGQPMIVCRPSRRRDREAADEGFIHLVPELCKITGLSDEMKRDMGLMRQLAQDSRKDANERFKAIEIGARTLTRDERGQRELSSWGIRLSDRSLSLTGLQYSEPGILVGPRQSVQYPSKANFTFSVNRSEMVRSQNLNNWEIISFGVDEEQAKNFYRHLRKAASYCNINVSQPLSSYIGSRDSNQTLRARIADAKNNNRQIVVCIVATDNATRYNMIKTVTLVENGVPSQVIKAKSLYNFKTAGSVATKILFQMEAKIGALLWGIQDRAENHMVIGYDTFHDQPRQRDKSVGAFVASMNDGFSAYYSRVDFHEVNQEMSRNFKNNVTKSLEVFKRTNNRYPTHIIIYRDGVGVGQYDHVRKDELAQVKDAIRALDRRIKLAFLIVTKRISTHLFAKDQNGRAFNPPPGTIVSDTITRQKGKDFYMVSQYVTQGTVTPTSFSVLYEDDERRKANFHPKLAYCLTHIYYNWMGGVKVPAPCQYAHKLAYLVGKSLHKQHHESLSNKLFYL